MSKAGAAALGDIRLCAHSAGEAVLEVLEAGGLPVDLAITETAGALLVVANKERK